MDKLVIFGTGVMGELVADHFRHASPWQVVAFTGHGARIKEDTCQGLPVVPFEEIEAAYPSTDYAIFVAISYAKGNANRRCAYLECKSKGYRFASYLSQYVKSLTPIAHGENVFINESVLQPHARIGNNVMIWANNAIGHHAVIGDHCFISSGVMIGGGTEVGESCYFGLNSSCKEYLKIADGSIIGAGVYLSRNSKPNEVCVAAPPKSFTEAPGEDVFLVRKVQRPSNIG